MTSVSTRGATGIRLSEAEAATLFDELSATRLRQAGVHQVAVTDEVTLSVDRGLATLSFIRFLREATSVGVWVSWSGAVDPALDTGSLCHLPPPSTGETGGGGSGWRANHEAGLCYYRVGPGFVQVTDRRPGQATRQVTLNADPHLDLFTRHLRPGPVPEAAGSSSNAYRDLFRDRLILRIAGHAVTLPHRLLCRPVPWNVF